MTASGKKVSIGAAVAASILIASLSTAAADGARTDEANASCRQETRRVAVWPTGGNPKSAQVARFENRTVTVCDGKVLSESPRNASTPEKRS